MRMPMWAMVVDHSCGHQETHKIIKSRKSEAEETATWHASRVCKQCWLTGERAKNNAEVEKLSGLALARLTGTDKQIGLATVLRGNYMLGLLRGTRWNPISNKQLNPVEKAYDIVAGLAHIKSSRWWIERQTLVAQSSEDEFRRDTLNGKFKNVK
jgi:hypothetical protein